ncbi:ribonuclease E/G [Actibacterium pelagium]|uniref:Ribonuclease G n=1 Tax=Actibacterium pelagium TaxID=2029103 RepID=A0A917AAU2_9RHOB|nr:ribonuclease E/G [Actibacterium pelagium]GGE37918.1 ribonuclease G [Actibacterium pelagium]
MKGRIVILDQLGGHPAAALMEDGVLQDLLVDSNEVAPGAIFRATVDRQIKGQGGVFLKLPDGRAFLRQSKGLAPGQTLLVQVTGYAEPGKATPVTTRLLFKSRYAIITPGAPGQNISRSIRDDDLRDELTVIAHEQMEGADENLGLILRSACANAPADEIAEDIANMRGLAEDILPETAGAPECLLDAPDAHMAAWRDWSDGKVDEIIDTEGSFEDLGVLDAANELYWGTPLAGGGSLFVEPTRALVAADVNTGTDTSPAAGLKANMAAARDLPRILRARGLGGQIVVDFAPMPKKDRRQLEQTLKAAFRADPVDTILSGWTNLGNFELQRKRERRPLPQGLFE